MTEKNIPLDLKSLDTIIERVQNVSLPLEEDYYVGRC